MGGSAAKPEEPPAPDVIAEKDEEIRNQQHALYMQKSQAAQERIRLEMSAKQAKMEAETDKYKLMAEMAENEKKHDNLLHSEQMKILQMHSEAMENQRQQMTIKGEEQREKYREQMEAVEKRAREKEEKVQKEKQENDRNAFEMMMQTQEKSHQVITRTKDEAQKQRELLLREQQQAMEKRDKEANLKLEKMNQDYNEKVASERKAARDIEEKLRLERKTMDEQYRKELSDSSNKSAEERKQQAENYKIMVDKKDAEISKNHHDSTARVDALMAQNRNDLEKANKEKETDRKNYAEEIKKLNDLRVKDLQEITEKEKKLFERMLMQGKESSMKELANATEMTKMLAITVSREMGYATAASRNEENRPLLEHKKELSDMIDNCTDTWMKLARQGQDTVSLKVKIDEEAEAFRQKIKQTRTLLQSVTQLENIIEWKEHLLKIEKAVRDYCRTVVKELADASGKRLEEMADMCEGLRDLVVDLPEVRIENLATMVSQGAAMMLENSQRKESAALKAVTEAEEAMKQIKYDNPNPDQK